MNHQGQSAGAEANPESGFASDSPNAQAARLDARTIKLILRAIEVGRFRLGERIDQVERKGEFADFEEEAGAIERRLNRIEARIDRVCEKMERLEGIASR